MVYGEKAGGRSERLADFATGRPRADCREQAMCTWMMAKATTSCPETQYSARYCSRQQGPPCCIGRRGHFVYDKLSFDGQELVSELLAQLTVTLSHCAGTEVAMKWLNGVACLASWQQFYRPAQTLHVAGAAKGAAGTAGLQNRHRPRISGVRGSFKQSTAVERLVFVGFGP